MQFYSLKARLRLALVGLAIIPLLIVGMALGIRTYNTQLDQVIQLQEEIVNNITNTVASSTGELLNILRVAAQVGGLRTGEPADQRNLLFELLSTEPAFDSLALIDITGQEVVRVSRLTVVTDADLENRADDEAFILPVQTQNIYYGRAEVDPATGQLLSTGSLPLSDPRTGAVTHVLVVDVRLGFLGTVLSQQNTEGVAYIVDDRERVIAHPNSSVVLRETLYTVPDSPGVYEGLTGESAVIAFRRLQLSTSQIIIVAELPTTIAFSLLTANSITLVIAVAITFIISLVLATLGTRFIIRPVQQLADVAQRIEAGDLSQRADVRGADEIGVLGKTFNAMTERLQNLIANLEQRVEERTKDLSIAAQVSQQVTRVLDMQELLPSLSNLTQQGFNLSHVSVFVHDPQTGILRLQAASGEAGGRMLQAGKQFHLEDKGLVPLAGRSFEAQIINDVTASPDHFVNPLLPLTRSEMAVPMRVGDQLIGVLDLQSNDVDHFSPEQANVLTALADQIAIAVRNADLFSEAELARHDAEQANQVKSMFLASMSHELRTPLNSIINFSKFVVRGIMGPVNERQQEALTSVVDSATHLLNLINDVLDISKIESGSLALFIENDVQLQPIIDAAQQTALSLIHDKPVTLTLDIAPDLPAMQADKQRLRQVLLNMLSNACKFTLEGEIKLKVSHGEGHVHIAVTDSGPGIAEEDFEAVFETFKQTETGMRHGGGTGLGMPISRRLVEAHGGKLWIESTPGQGSTFHVRLPIIQTAIGEKV